MSKNTVYDYGDDIRSMVRDARQQAQPRPFHVDIRGGHDPEGNSGLFLVATWKHGNRVWLAWKPAPEGYAEQLRELQLWVGLAQLEGFATRGGIADYRCWPLPSSPDSGWAVMRRLSEQCKECEETNLTGDETGAYLECPGCGSHGPVQGNTWHAVNPRNIKVNVGSR